MISYRIKIPTEYFITYGIGESDYGIHAGSLDQALKQAGIHNVNIIFYTSIIPKEAKEVKPRKLHFGEVVDLIAAVANGEKGQRVTAGLIIGHVYKANEKVGSLVAEYHGNEDEEKAKENLKNCLNEMFESRFSKKEYELKDVKIIVKSFVPKKKYGTAIVAIVFTKYKLI